MRKLFPNYCINTYLFEDQYRAPGDGIFLVFSFIMKKLLVVAALISAHIAALGQGTDSVTVSDTVVTNVQITATPAPDWTKQPAPTGEVYKIRPGLDIPIAAVGTGWTLYGFSQIYSKERSSEAKILSLNKNNIPKIDRKGASVYHEKANDHADMLFYGSMPLPVILMLDKEIRKDALKIGLLYLEAMAITGTLYTGSAYLADRYRPYAYNPEVPMDQRRRGGAKNSFFAGHVALVGTSTFFVAKVWNDYHPESRLRWIPFTLAGIATGSTAWFRHRGGQHFPTDIMLGTAVGTLSGILVPHLHKNKNVEDRRMTFTAGYLFDTPQFGFTYKLMK